MSSHRRGPWSQAEDNYLVQLVHTQGALNWVRIAQLIGSRSPKQCRERYHQNLKPSLNHDPISPEEGLQIERLVAEMGKRWADIARRLHGRSDNAVKNWWNGSMNRRRRLVVRRRGSSRCSNDYEDRPQRMSYAGPQITAAVMQRQPLTIASTYSHERRYIDPSLPSPSVSEGSRADSLDAAPSLVSDNGSTVSVSPLVVHSPGLELPPLHSSNGNGSSVFLPASVRRPSAPVMQLVSHPYVSDSEARGQLYSPRYAGFEDHQQQQQQKAPPPPPTYHQRHSEQQINEAGHFATAPREAVYQARGPSPHLVHSARLPPLRREPVQLVRSPPKDSRMNLSTLLA